MKKTLGFMVLSMSLAASPVFAGGHGSHGSEEHGASQTQAPMDDQNAKESEMILNNCAKYVDRIHQCIQKLQADIKGKQVGDSVRDELKKLEHNMKEANDIVRSLQIL